MEHHLLKVLAATYLPLRLLLSLPMSLRHCTVRCSVCTSTTAQHCIYTTAPPVHMRNSTALCTCTRPRFSGLRFFSFRLRFLWVDGAADFGPEFGSTIAQADRQTIAQADRQVIWSSLVQTRRTCTGLVHACIKWHLRMAYAPAYAFWGRPLRGCLRFPMLHT